MRNIYEAKFVEALFDKMSYSYEGMNYISSFGFSIRWRKQFIDKVEIKPGDTVADLMTGMGECWSPILSRTGASGKIIALDFSEGMLQHARKRKQKYARYTIDILKEDVFANSIPDQSVDVIVSGFGIKTFSPEQLKMLSDEFKRILKPGGKFSLVDVSVPTSTWLKPLYMSYLKLAIPFIGKVFLGNSEVYRMLGIYTEEFGNAKQVAEILQQAGFEVKYVEYFWGCASGVVGNIEERETE